MQNAWYIAMTQEELKDVPQAVTILTKDIVLFRDSKGVPHALKNQCAHRGARLSDGRCIQDAIACPFHGWEYKGDGICRYIPANGLIARIPKRACVPSYPVLEQSGYIWVFIGRPDQQRDLTLPEELLDPAWKKVPFQAEWNAHITRVVESILDVSHLPFVHPETTGFDVDPTVAGPEFKASDTEIHVIAQPYHPLLRTPLNENETKGISTITFTFPNQIMLRTDMFQSNRMCTYLSFTPVTDDQIKIYGLALRNFFVDFDVMDEVHYNHNLKVLAQDQPIVERLRPKQVPLDLSKEQHVRSDAQQIRYRMMLRKALEQKKNEGLSL